MRLLVLLVLLARLSAADAAQQLDYDDPAGSEQRLRAALGEPMDTEHRVRLETQLARTLGMQRKFAEGHAVLDAVEARADLDAEGRVRCALERGRLFNTAGETAKAMPRFAEARERAHAAGLSALEGDAVHMLALAAPPEEAGKYHLDAIALAEASTVPGIRAWRPELWNNYAAWLEDRGRIVDALAAYERARRVFGESAERGEPQRIADWAVAHALRRLGAFEPALAALRALEREEAELGKPDGSVYEELGECLLGLGRGEEAKPSFARAAELLAHDPDMTPERLARLRQLGGG